jgi:hypothetical protein
MSEEEDWRWIPYSVFEEWLEWCERNEEIYVLSPFGQAVRVR